MSNIHNVPAEKILITAEKKRKHYHRPGLVKLGDLRALTLGGSSGRGDSPNYTSQKPFGASNSVVFPLLDSQIGSDDSFANDPANTFPTPDSGTFLPGKRHLH